MELFDKRFVHFMWDDSLDGKWGFCSSDIQSLQMFVEAGADPRRWKEGTPPYFLKKGAEKKPFMVQGLGFFSFAYYDPNYGVKWAYYKEGKKVQVGDYIGNWADCHGEPHWSDNCKYRIKPECPCEDGKRKYKPYVTVDEFIQDFQERFPTAFPRPAYTKPLIWVRLKVDKRERLIVTFGTNFVEIGNKAKAVTLQKLFEDYEFLDGSPVGKEVKE